MNSTKQELVEKIEKARQELNNSIDRGLDYELIYQHSVALDRWIEEYITAGY